MAKSKKNQEEAQEVEAQTVDVTTPEQYEVLFQKRVKSEIKKYNLADTEIAKLKKKYSGLVVKGVEDKAGLKTLSEAISDVRSKRTAIERKRKELGEDYLKTKKAIDGEAKRLTELLLEVEEPLKAEKERIDAIIKEEKERKEKEEAAKLDARVEDLKAAGMVFNGSFYVIGDTISMDVVTLKQMADSDFEFLKAKVIMEAEKIRKEEEEEARKAAEAEAKRQAEIAKLREEQEALEREREAFRKQQEEFAAQKRAMEEAQEKARREEEERLKKIELQKEQEERERLDRIFNSRVHELELIGFFLKSQYKKMIFQNDAGTESIDLALLRNSSEEHWNEQLKTLEISVKELKESQTLIDQKKEEEKRQAILKAEAELKAAEEEKERERLERLPDVEKAENYLNEVMALTPGNIANEAIQEIISEFEEGLRSISEVAYKYLDDIK